MSNGSSPLTRGKPVLALSAPTVPGLIPAHAGKTVPVHTPARGVHGSSPLTRGKLHVGHLLTWYLGLIPAHAGKT